MNKKQTNTTTAFRFKRYTKKSYSVFNSLNKVVTIGFLTGCALMNAHASSVGPNEAIRLENKTDTIAEQDLEELVVTASKAELPMSQASKIVTLITRDEIERSPAQSIQDLLNYVAGIDVMQRGPHGVQSDISLRGGSFDQVAILLNGINLTNPQTGHYSFDIPINLSDIERIEIVHGPASLVYGASAFAGGINIITKKDTESNAFVKVQGGMHNLLNTEARGAYKTSTTLHQLSAGYSSSSGYMDNSDYNMLNLLWQSRFDIERNTLDLQAGYNSKEFGANTFYSPSYPNQFDDTESMFLSAKGETNGKLKFIPQLYWNRHYDCFQLIREGTPDIPDWYTNHNYHRTDVMGANITFQYASQLGITSFGGEFRNEGIMSNVLGKPMDEPIGKYTKSDNRTAINYFAEQNFLFKNMTLSIGALLNHNTANTDQFNFYPAINSSFRISKDVSLYASWNKATRMPTFTDLYYTTQTHIGNSNLQSEQSEALEAGVKLSSRAIRGNFTTFYMKGRNLIDWVKPNEEALWESRNHSKINKRGVETNINMNLKELLGKSVPLNNLSLGYLYLDQSMVDDELISNYTLNHLRHKFTASLQHDIVRNLSVSWNFLWQQRTGSYLKYEELKATEITSYEPFGLLDIKINYQLRNINLYANINNVLNTEYLDLGNLPQPGIWVMAGVNYTIR
ncbi:MAG: TonB-dependent receptor [Dysgonamonadaceae bacterium]|nr:TonB-dependent receptor [Dysgonamonadaceae bacterium]